jgi:GR25 family glycosyltransferase involved in LPS biosynthesis
MLHGVTWVTESCYHATFYEILSENKLFWPIDYHLFPALKENPGDHKFEDDR